MKTIEVVLRGIVHADPLNTGTATAIDVGLARANYELLSPAQATALKAIGALSIPEREIGSICRGNTRKTLLKSGYVVQTNGMYSIPHAHHMLAALCGATPRTRNMAKMNKISKAPKKATPNVEEVELRGLIADARTCGSRGAAGRQPLLVAGADAALAKLSRIRKAVEDYYDALERREHGGVACGEAMNSIENVLGLSWDAYKAQKNKAKAAS